MSYFKPITVLLSIAVTCIASSASWSADYFSSGDAAGRYTRHAPIYPAYQQSSASVVGTECGQLLVTYRQPYEPRREVVTICHPPLQWD
jgi:hypothetical protein